MIACTGYNSTIVRALAILRPEEVIEKIVASPSPTRMDCEFSWSPGVTRFILAAGVLHQKQILDQSHNEIQSSIAINLVNAVRLIETIFLRVPNARVCAIGSQSGINGSFDMTYALSKAALQKFMRWKQIARTQTLVCIAPPIIADSGMTWRRNDYPGVLEKRRHVFAKDVAELVDKALWKTETGSKEVWEL